MSPVLVEGKAQNLVIRIKKLEAIIYFLATVQLASPLGLILVQPERLVMSQMTAIQLPPNEKKMMRKILKKILMTPTMMSLLAMEAPSSTRTLTTKMMRKLMQFMKLLMSVWMKKEESTERKGARKKLKSIVRKDQKSNSNSVTLKENCVQYVYFIIDWILHYSTL